MSQKVPKDVQKLWEQWLNDEETRMIEKALLG